MMEVFLSNGTVLQPVTLLRNETLLCISSWELYKIFRNGYARATASERILQFTIYWVLGNFLKKENLEKNS